MDFGAIDYTPSSYERYLLLAQYHSLEVFELFLQSANLLTVQCYI